jgi:hypothetical protein
MLSPEHDGDSDHDTAGHVDCVSYATTDQLIELWKWFLNIMVVKTKI